MTIPVESIRALPVAELRRLVKIRENIDRIEELMRRRDRLYEEARLIQNQIDELISKGLGTRRQKRQGPSVKALCEEVLRQRKSGLAAAEVKNAILDKYPHRDNRTFYNQVFIALSRGRRFKKLRNGKFVLVPGKDGRT